MPRIRPVSVLFLVTAFVAIPVLAQAQSPPASGSRFPAALESCTLTGGMQALCGTYAVWEDRAARKGRRIDLHIVILPALVAPSPSPLVLLAGGPGEAATAMAPFLAPFRAAMPSRDIVLVDQRGTGNSNGLSCHLFNAEVDVQAYLDNPSPAERIRECRETLEERADLRFYTTDLAMQDLEEIRAWLGYVRLDLWGSSYGSNAGLTYLRLFPNRVRSATFAGVVPPWRLPYQARARNAHRSLQILFLDCSTDPECAVAFPDLEADFNALVERLERQPVEVETPHPVTGELQRAKLGRETFTLTVLYMLWYADSAAYLPSLIHQAAQGDFGPTARISVLLRHRLYGGESIHDGMFYSVTCAESVPRIDPARAAAESVGTFLGDARIAPLLAACAEWPRRQLPAEHFKPPRGVTSPVLLLSGWLDWIPPRWAEDAASWLPNSRHVVGRYGHHEFPRDRRCHLQVLADFLERGSLAGLDVSCLESIPRVPFVLDADFSRLEALFGGS